MSFSNLLIHCWEKSIISGWVMMFCWMRDWWMEYMWGGIGYDLGVSELVLMTIIWRYFLQMAFLNSQRILLKWLLWSIYKQREFERGKVFWETDMGLIPVGLSLRKVMYKSQCVGMCVNASVFELSVYDFIPIYFEWTEINTSWMRSLISNSFNTFVEKNVWVISFPISV